MNATGKAEIASAFGESCIVYTHQEETLVPTVTNEYSVSTRVCFLERLVHRIIHTKGELFSIGTNKFSHRNYIKNTKLGEAVFNALRMGVGDITQHFPVHRFNPYVGLLITEVNQRNLHEYLRFPNSLPDHHVWALCDMLNGLVTDIRKEGTSQRFRKKIGEFVRLMNKNYRSLCRYIDVLFEHYSRLLVLRLDLGYAKVSPNGTECSITYDLAKKHREALLKQLTAKLPPDCLAGYVWKLEYGLDKSWHYHVMLLLDGAKVREDITIARMVGELWIFASDGAGIYYNCNAFKGGYKYCGIGMISHFDSAQRENLRRAALYLTKTDYYVKMVAPGNGRTFGKGIMRNVRSTKQGRPRTRRSNAELQSQA